MADGNGHAPGERASLPAEALRHYWFPVARSEEVADKPVAARLLDEPIVLWRSNGQIAAFYDLCIHRGTPLSLGWIDDGELVCGYHGWRYNTAAACTRIPSLPPERAIPAKARATPYRVAERYGLVWVCLDEPVADIPEFPPEFEDESFRWGVFSYESYIHANAARFIENLMDFSHFAWVHPGILGSRDQPECQPYTVEPTSDGFQFEIGVPRNTIDPDGSPERTNYRVIAPFMIILRRFQLSGDQRQIAFWVCSPITTRETKFYRFMGRNYSRLDDDEEIQIAKQIFEQDRAIVEAQRPEELPVDLREELHLRGPDTGALEYRKLLARIGVDWG
jgi:phenylpropionate dioxygenase-like ring-hydroxylating dioxygenase large terminal subunit